MIQPTTISMTFDSPEEAAAALILLATEAGTQAPKKKASAKKDAPAKEKPAAKKAATKDEPPAAEDVQRVLQAYSGEHGKDEAVAKLKEAGGVTRLKDLPEDKRQAVIDAVT